MAEEFEIVRNANPSLVEQAQANVGVVFLGENEIGNFRDGIVKQKPNAKEVSRQKVEEYDPERDNTPQVDTDPFDPKIKEKNNVARNLIIPLLNPMGKSDAIRLNSIEQELEQDIAIEKAKPNPDPEILNSYNKQKLLIYNKKEFGDKGREGIVFPPRVDGENLAKVNL
jgi:hypothetical protein